MEFIKFDKTLIYGLIAGGAFIGLNLVNASFAIGNPYALWASVLAVALVAPITEELFFRGTVQPLLEKVTKNLWLGWVAILAQAGIFAGFHYFAYGASLSAVTTPFIGAFVFGIAMTLLMKKTNNILPCILAHGIFNFFLVQKYLLAIGV
jgi:membrane protease YdiL (CAAX protease family)